MYRLAVAVSLLTLVACGAGTGPGAYKADFKTNTEFFTNTSTPAPSVGNSPHGLQRTWYSTNIKDQLGSGDLPTGTVAIKENYTADGGAVKIFVMVKTAKDSWFYERRNPNGDLDSSLDAGINVNPCFGCHMGFQSTDYLGATNVKN